MSSFSDRVTLPGRDGEPWMAWPKRRFSQDQTAYQTGGGFPRYHDSNKCRWIPPEAPLVGSGWIPSRLPEFQDPDIPFVLFCG